MCSQGAGQSREAVDEKEDVGRARGWADQEAAPPGALEVCWEKPCLVSEAVTPMVKAESELGP